MLNKNKKYKDVEARALKKLQKSKIFSFFSEFPMLRNIALQDCLFAICGTECDYADELSDAHHCRRICEEGANLLGFEDFEEYLCNVSQPTLLSRTIREEEHVCRSTIPFRRERCIIALLDI